MSDWRDDLDAKQREALRRTGMPASMPPMLATLTDERYSSPDWIFERKLDGDRQVAVPRQRHQQGRADRVLPRYCRGSVLFINRP